MTDHDELRNRIEVIVQDCARELAAGSRPDFGAIQAAHPDLMPILGEELTRLAAIEDGVRGVRIDDTATSDRYTGLPVHVGASHQLKPGDHVGPYLLEAELGEGGMGIVFRAQQERPKRQVALKIIRPQYATAQLLRRFEHEADVLGRLLHPGIAQIYEAGTYKVGDTERPFFAMELVAGQSLTRHAEEHKLSLRQRLELFSRICDAVQHAHQKGVIHRDLKPGNILVTDDGQAKILDFGVARATDSDLQLTTVQTDVAQLIGTVPYMSPEQVGGRPEDLDTRSDVYALGVVLYELLAGRLPYDLKQRLIHEAARIIREEEPTKLSSINVALRGDVETIVAKALEKEKDRRYQSATELSLDIRRYLHDEPIAARPASAGYQVRKFAARNKALVGGVIATFVVLVAGTITSTWFAVAEAEQRRAAEASKQLAEDRFVEAESARKAEETQRKLAEQQRDKAETINEFVTKALVSSDPNKGGAQGFLVTDAMEQAVVLLDAGELKDQPETEASLRLTISGILNGNGHSAEALRLARRALEITEQLHPGDHPRVGNGLDSVAGCLHSLGRWAEALPKFAAALEMRLRLFGGDHPDVATSMENIAICLDSLGRSDEALSKHEAALEMFQRLYDGEHPRVAASLNGVAFSLDSLGRSEEALPKYEAVLEMSQRLFGGDHPDVATSLNNVAFCLDSLGRSAEALPKYEAALEMRLRLFEGDHPMVALGLNNVAACLDSLGRSAEALPKYEAALEMKQRLFEGDHPDVALSLNNVASCLNSLERVMDFSPIESLRS